MAKISIKSGKNKQSLTPFNLDVEHITTSDFGSVFPTMIHEVVPGDKFEINYSQFTRMSPLAVPTFGRASIVSRAFFVPNSALFPQWRKWITNDRENSDLINYPSVRNDLLYDYFTNETKDLTVRNTDVPVVSLRPLSSKEYILTDALGKVLLLPLATVSSWTLGATLTSYSASQLYSVAFQVLSDGNFFITFVKYDSSNDNSIINSLGISTSVTIPNGSSSGFAFVQSGGNRLYIGLVQASGSSFILSTGQTAVLETTPHSNGTTGFFTSTSLLVRGSTSSNSHTYNSNTFNEFSVPNFDFTSYFLSASQVWSSVFYTFTEKGRLFNKILSSLGYRINWTAADTTEFSLLPLLAYFRCMYDYLYPSRYVRYLDVAGLFDDFKNWTTDSQVLDAMCKLLFAPLSADYFTLAWSDMNAVFPNPSLTDITMDVPESNGIIKSTKDSNAYYPQGDGGMTPIDGNFFTQYGLRLLTAISDFVTRNNIAGARYFEQMRARFGLKGSNIDPDKSRFLTTWSDELRIEDVTATNGTTTQLLGEQAGKGIVRGSGHHLSFDNTNGDYGWLIVITQIVPKTGICQGRLRHTLRTSYLDYFTPEFEQVGLQPIRNDELFSDFVTPNDYNNGLNYGGKPSGVFGFAPRYSEYKRSTMMLTGDFQYKSRNVGMESYHLMRLLPTPSQANPLALNINFMSVQQTDYDRIFSQQVDSQGNSFDHFFNWFYFDVKAYRPMLSIGESMPIENGSGLEELDYEGVHLTT